MIIRATKKVLNVNKIKPVKKDLELSNGLPGEWFVDLISLGEQGRFALQYVHNPTRISVIVPGRSINKGFKTFQERVANYLSRFGYEKLIPYYDLDSQPEILATNNRSILGHLNRIKWDVEYHCNKVRDKDSIDYAWIEDIFFDSLFTTKATGSKYISVKTILDDYLAKISGD
ncbi:MAG: hypothetical protein K9I94_06670 [Bacteroidales bacterium]|nr:hypothetical protein [Bacteroidales bacterium]